MPTQLPQYRPSNMIPHKPYTHPATVAWSRLETDGAPWGEDTGDKVTDTYVRLTNDVFFSYSYDALFF